MNHSLKIEVEDIWDHPNYIRVSDWSEYNTVIPVLNRVLRVDIPGVEDYAVVPLPQSSSFIYTSKGFKISAEPEPLNDGLWTFTYSLAPNDQVYTRVYHYRTIKLEREIYAMLTGLLASEDILKEVMTKRYKNMIQCLLMLKSLKATCITDLNSSAADKLYKSIQVTACSISVINNENVI